jgi:flagellar biogenesis protein FliO
MAMPIALFRKLTLAALVTTSVFATTIASFAVSSARADDAVVVGTNAAPVASSSTAPVAPVGPATTPARSLASSLPRETETATGDFGSLAEGARERGFFGEILPTAAALGGTLLVIVLTRSVIKRFGGQLGPGKRPSGVVVILARYPVARGQQVVLLKVGRRVLVVHQGAQAMQTLSEFSEADDVADLITRCEAGTKNAKDPTRDFSFDALLRTAGKSFDEETGAGRAARIDPRDALPAVMRGAEIETVDLTRARKNTRGGGSR